MANALRKLWPVRTGTRDRHASGGFEELGQLPCRTVERRDATELPAVRRGSTQPDGGNGRVLSLCAELQRELQRIGHSSARRIKVEANGEVWVSFG